MEAPPIFTTGARLSVKYRSPQSNRTQTVVGFIIKDEKDVLVVEEYHNFARVSEDRHILVDMETLDLFTQTGSGRTQRIGQVTLFDMWSPPWDSVFDTMAGGFQIPAMMEELHQVSEGISKYVDPDQLDQPDEWSPDDPVSDPLPEEMVDRNPETAYQPDVDVSRVVDRRPDTVV